jgi:CRISPR-associated protein Cmr6
MLFKNLDKWAEKNNKLPNAMSSDPKLGRVLSKSPSISQLSQSPPMMYRAQIAGRCNLQFAGDNHNLQKWRQEWVMPQRDENPSCQYIYEPLDDDHPNNLIHSIKILFPYRVLSNSGQDSILRPVLTAHGIPFIPGSSVKGIFKRLIYKPENSVDRETILKYCGTEEEPGILRFHGAYPIGNWSKQMVDIVHPQQIRQVEENKITSAFTLISFYQPEFIFEFSSINSDLDWKNVERILRKALTYGLGGKTSTGYGFVGNPIYADAKNSDRYSQALHISFESQGVSSTLLNRHEEFRPNMFKAALRGHLMRLLAGACSNKDTIEENINSLLGSTDREGIIKLFWESKGEDFFPFNNQTTYTTNGTLHISIDPKANLEDLSYVGKVAQFAYVMGGFGKSWRRVWHKKFKPRYTNFAIGCHWQSKSNWMNFEGNFNVDSKDTLKLFLDDLHQICIHRLGLRSPQSMGSWREIWHPDNVHVFALVTNTSKAIDLFHNEIFKYTSAIGGRSIRRKNGQEEKDTRPTSISSVWHRMLPIGDDKYLEIVTVFRQGNWKHLNEGNMRDRFIRELLDREFKLAWGNETRT